MSVGGPAPTSVPTAPVNDYAVHASLTVSTNSAATANSSALSAIATINSDLASLSENVGFSAAEVEGTDQTSPTLAWERVGGGTSFAVEAWLLVGAQDKGSAQSIAEDAAAAIVTALTGTDPAVVVSLESENGQYVFAQL